MTSGPPSAKSGPSRGRSADSLGPWSTLDAYQPGDKLVGLGTMPVTPWAQFGAGLVAPFPAMVVGLWRELG